MTDKEILYLLVAEDLCRQIKFFLDGDAYIVGGAPRNIMVGKSITDVDITTNIHPVLLDTIPDLKLIDISGGKWGSYKVLYREHLFDVTEMRGEEIYEDGKLKELNFAADILSDSERRDFGINTGYLRVGDKGNLSIQDPLDLFWDDLTKKEIDFVGMASERIKEDPLRMIRACRIAAELGWAISERTSRAVMENVEEITVISQERIREELSKILLTSNIGYAFGFMYKCGLLSFILPELHYAMSVEQNKHHRETVGEHLILTAEAIRKPNLLLRWAALLHDIAKPKVREYNKKKKDWTFYNHEVQSAFDAKAIMRRFKFSNREIDHVFRVIYNHMYFITKQTQLSTVRNFMFRAGRDVIRDILRLRIADRIANLTKNSNISLHLKMLVRLIRKIEKEEKILKVTDLKFNGHDAMALGLEGKAISDLLNHLLVKCISNPKYNKPKALKKLADKYLKDRRNQTCV